MNTDLHNAVRYGYLKMVRELIANELNAVAKSLDVNAKDGFDCTPLHFAVRYGHLEVVRELIINGADINAKDINGGTSLYFAVTMGRTEIAKLLEEYIQVDIKEPCCN